MKTFFIADIGGTSIKYAIFDEDGAMLEKGSQPKQETSVPNLVEDIGRLFEDKCPQASCIALSCNMIINPDEGEMYGGSYDMDGDSYPLRAEVEKRCSVPVHLIKDSNAALLAELRTGSLAGAKNAIAIILGTGIGMAICLNGQTLLGDNYFAGEASMMTIGAPFAENPREYCWMRYNSVPYTVMRVAQELGEDPRLFTGREWFERIEAGNPKACALFEEYCDTLALQIMNLTMLLDIHRISIGGGISAQPLLIEKLREKVARLNGILRPSAKAPVPDIVPCKYRNDANLYGAFYSLKEKSL